MDNCRSTNQPEIILKFQTDSAYTYLKQEEISACRSYYRGTKDSKQKIANTIYGQLNRYIRSEKLDRIEPYLTEKRNSPEYQAAFGKGGSSTSAAAWSGGQDSTYNNGPDPSTWRLGWS